MRHLISGKKLNRNTNHRKMLFRFQIRQLVENGFMTTTITKAKIIKSNFEKLINSAKNANLNMTRKLVAEYGNKEVAKKIKLIAETVKTQSGFLKSVRLGKRLGDNTMMVRLELIPQIKEEAKLADSKEEDSSKKTKTVKKETKKK